MRTRQETPANVSRDGGKILPPLSSEWCLRGLGGHRSQDQVEQLLSARDVPVEGHRARAEAFRERTHGQGIGAVLVDEGDSRVGDSLYAAARSNERSSEMDAGIVKLVIGGVIGAHGVGHVLGWMPALGIARFQGLSSHSWLLSGLVGEDVAKLGAGVLFVLPTVGFVAAAAGLLTGQPWWRQVAVGSAVVSLACTALYPQAYSTSSTVGALVVNAAVLYAILVANWGVEAAA